MTTPDFSASYAADRSPIYRALWEEHAAIDELFHCDTDVIPTDQQRAMDNSLAVLRKHRAAKSLRGPIGKHSEQVLRELGDAGYWGLLVEREYGGSSCGLRHFLPFLTRAAVIDAPLAGLAAVHGCIGAVDPLQTFGTSEQKARWLPKLASGERLSAFASTEPNAGSDLAGIQMTAVRDGDSFRLTGQKSFITNLAPGRTIGLVCKFDNRLAVAIVDLPERENSHFQLISNPLHPLKHTINQGMRLTDFLIPANHWLQDPQGKDGRAIVFHGLNRGRAALCALAAGHLRVLLTGMLAWARERTVRGQSLASLELIQARLGRIAALIAGCDVLAGWCGQLLDAGYRAEVECITAKVFASEALKQAVVDLALPTHGGRFFLQGHSAGDMLYDYLAPCIYEGENDLLCLAMFQALAKGHFNAPEPASQPNDWSASSWNVLRSRIKEPMSSRGPNKTPLQAEMIAIAREAQTLVTYCLVEQSPPQADWRTRAQRLLSLQLRRRFGLLGGQVTMDELLAEIELGQALLATPPEDLHDAPPFINPLPISSPSPDQT